MLKDRIYDLSVIDRVSEATFTRNFAGSEWKCHDSMDVREYQPSGRDILCIHPSLVIEGYLSQVKAVQ